MLNRRIMGIFTQRLETKGSLNRGTGEIRERPEGEIQPWMDTDGHGLTRMDANLN